MMSKRRAAISPVFVDSIPDRLEDGFIYISIKFAMATHRCCCGCGREVITPFSPTDWRLVFDGEAISLDPSIGNWSYPCQSHYWIRRNRVTWAPRWSRAQIEAASVKDREVKEGQFAVGSERVTVEGGKGLTSRGSGSWLRSRLGRWFTGRKRA